MKRNKVILLVIASVCIVLCMLFMCSAVKTHNLDNIVHITSREKRFSDVTQNDWFYSDVKTVSGMGLMVGQSATSFNPNGNVTLAETYTLAARIHSIYETGHERFQQKGIWYQVYLDYAKNAGIYYLNVDNYNRGATRAEFAQILASAFPPEALAEINSLSEGDIPDVSLSSSYGEAVYTLYRAGVLKGNDAALTFYPNSSIKRSEVAAVVSRMADPESRVAINPSFGIVIPKEETDENTPAETPEIPVAPDTGDPTFHIETVTAKAGEKRVAVTISVKNNPGISALRLNLSHDSGIVLTDIVYNNQLSGETMLPQTVKNPVYLIWMNPYEDVEEDFVLATVYFDVLSTAAEGSHQIAVTYHPDDVFEISEDNVYFEVVQGSVYVTE